MAESKEYIVKTTSTRELHIKKQVDGNYQIRLWWAKGEKDLATLVLEPGEMKKLGNTALGLLKK